MACSSPPTARVLVLEAPGRLVPHERALPTTGDDDGILRVEACGLCGTDHEQFSGVLPIGAPVVPGHETVGVIERVGRRAAKRWGVDEGDRVAVEVFQSCRSCPACDGGTYRHCAAHGIADMYGFIPFDRAPGLWGGYASHLYLSPHAMVLKVPPSLDPVTATLFNPLGAGIRWGTTVPHTAPGQSVVVLGPGIRGLSVLAAVKQAGAGYVLVVGKGAGDAARLELARAFGADAAVDCGTGDPVEVLRRDTGALADVVVDVTAGAPEALGQAVALARPGATVVVAGTRGTSETPGFHPDLLVYKELRVQGALGVDVDAYRAALELLESGDYPFTSVPRRCASLDAVEVTDLLHDMSAPGPGADRPVHAVVVP
jgi:alcohol dehydrogenase